jgi:hypothetical protein
MWLISCENQFKKWDNQGFLKVVDHKQSESVSIIAGFIPFCRFYMMKKVYKFDVAASAK